MRTNLLVSAEPDGLPTTPIRRWALDKYQLVALYSRLFSTGMKRKWPVRVYIDLCAGSGFSELEETKQLYRGSPLLALGVPDPFDNYIFCEEDPDSLRALTRRTGRLFPQSNIRIIEGNCDEQLGKIAAAIPTGPGVLSFCFADPFDLSIKFSTVEHLASGRVDFLFVLALHMDANRNIAHYVQGENRKIDEFLGLSTWRTNWRQAEGNGIGFPRFLAESFSKRMQDIGYLPVPFHKMKQIRSDVKNLPLYHLALFSKHERAFGFWDEVLKYADDQTSFEFRAPEEE